MLIKISLESTSLFTFVLWKFWKQNNALNLLNICYKLFINEIYFISVPSWVIFNMGGGRGVMLFRYKVRVYPNTIRIMMANFNITDKIHICIYFKYGEVYILSVGKNMFLISNLNYLKRKKEWPPTVENIFSNLIFTFNKSTLVYYFKVCSVKLDLYFNSKKLS